MTTELSQIQLNHLNAAFLFENHRRRVLDAYFPPDSISDLALDPLIEFHCNNPYLWDSLRSSLPFGRYLSQSHLDQLTNRYNTTRFTYNARTQLLYWYLARSYNNPLRPPVDRLAIYYEPDQFWFNHIVTQRSIITRRLLVRNPTFFLRRFTLNHDHFELEIGGLRLITNRPELFPSRPEGRSSFQIVHCDHATYTYNWTLADWTIVTHRADTNLVDPDQPFFLPPSSPVDPDFASRVQEPLRYYTPDISVSSTSSLPSSSIPDPRPRDARLLNDTEFNNPVTDFNQPISDNSWDRPASWISQTSCWCHKEVCDCGFRPDTPPTPPSVTLWSPGSHNLPSNHP